jgi:hypothetical protein
MPRFLNAAVLRRFVCGGCGGSRKPAENKDAAVLRRMGALTPHTPYAPLARFKGAQGAVPGGTTSRLARFLFELPNPVQPRKDRLDRSDGRSPGDAGP